MSLQRQQDFLARLFTDECLRQNFLSAPEKIGAENGLSELETKDLKTILPDQLNFFADSLYWKRLREVERFLPLSRKILNDGFEKLFREFSQNFNPQTVKKHLEDAFEFCRFLQEQNISEFAQNTAKFERAKLEFYGYGRRLVVCRLEFDFRKISREDARSQSLIPEKKRKFAIWLKIRGKTRHFTV